MIKIKELINNIIINEKEGSNYYYNFIKFDVKIWEPYIKNVDLNLDKLKFIKKILIACKEVDNNIDPESIGLDTKIHVVGFNLIKNGKLTGEKLIEFLGEDEAFYTEEKINILKKKNKYLESEVNYLERRVSRLSNENDNLESKINSLKSDLSDLKDENVNLKSKINSLKSDLSDLKDEMNKEIRNLKGEIKNLKEVRKNSD